MSGKTLGAGSTTPDNKKDYWNTPWHAVHDASALVGQPFVLDACATDRHAAKAYLYISPDEDALKEQWDPEKPGAVWCNPPFSQKFAFLERAHQQSILHGLTICVMVPYERCTKWWQQYVNGRATVVYVPDGRYNYCDDTTKEEISGVNFASCFVVFTPLTMPTQYVDFLRGIGKQAANDNG
jgi:phage N-6-adenine-methyltransferase